MYEQDEEVADYLGHLMDKHDWPKYIRTTTGKNKGDRIIRVMRKAKGRLPMTSAVQSLNPVVLKNIRRQNISLDTYSDIQKELHSQGMQSYGELILCMPGESKQTFFEAVDKLIETGVSRVSAHQLMLLHGAPLSDPDQRERFGFETRFRIVARCLGNYTDEKPIIETEEMVVETPDFSFDDYLETRVFHLLLTIYYYEDNFEEAFKLAREFGFRPFQVVQRMQALLAQAPKEFRWAIDEYVRENKEELYDTREECVAAAEQNFDRLMSGKLGGNLLSKYSMIGRFFVLPEAVDFLETTLRSLVEETDFADGLPLVRCVSNYYRSVMLHAPFANSLAATPQLATQYDIEAWRRSDYAKPLSAHALKTQKFFTTAIDPRTKSLIESRLKTFGENPQGMGKFTRTMFAKDLRRAIKQAPPAS